MSTRIPFMFREERSKCVCNKCVHKRKHWWKCSINVSRLYLDIVKNTCKRYEELK